MTALRAASASVALLVLAGCEAPLGLETPRGYPCDRDAGPATQCPEGFRCGLEGRCHDTSVAAAYVCDTDLDCEGAWHCGAERFCYPLDAGAPYPCRVDRDDCAVGWKCGLEDVCHPLGEGAPYACLTDDDCEASWRCDPDGRCANAALEAPVATVTVSLVASALEGATRRTRADHLGFTAESHVDSDCGGLSTESYSLTHGALLTKLFLYDRPLRRRGSDGGCASDSSGDTLAGAMGVVQLSGPAQDVIDLGLETFVLQANGTMTRYAFDPIDGGVTSASLPGTFVDGGLQLIERPEGRRQVAAFSVEGAFGLFEVSDGGYQGVPTIRLGDPAPRLTDVAAVSAGAGALQLVATSPQSFYWMSFSEGSGGAPYQTSLGSAASLDRWEASRVPGVETPACSSSGPTGDDRPLRLLTDPKSGVASLLWMQTRQGIADGGYVDELHGINFGSPHPGTVNCPPMAAGSSTWAVGTSSIAICAQGGAFSQILPVAEHLLAYCLPLDGGAPVGELLGRGPPDEPSELFMGPITVGAAGATRVAASGRAGQLWHSTPYALFWSALLDRSPTVVLGTAGALVASAPQVTPHASTDSVFSRQTFFQSDPLGLRAYTGDGLQASPMAAVRGKPEWGVYELGSGYYGVAELVPAPKRRNRLAGLMSPDEEWRGPFQSAATSLPDGGTLLVVTSFDALLAAVVPSEGLPFEPDDLEGIPELKIQTVPYPRTPFVSLALAQRAPGAASSNFAEGFAIIQGRVVRLVARSVSLWNAEEIPMPLVDPVEVWTDGVFGRVGYADGRVFSINTRVQIQGPLAPGAGAVLEYEQVCGKPVVRTRNGLFRPSASATSSGGEWTPIAVPSALLPPGHDYATDKLYAADGVLYLFTAAGWVNRIDGFGCP